VTPDVVVVGGGTAGLAAATALAERGARVRLLEARASCGGRARSWVDAATGHVEDNGQHVVLGCYDAFLAFTDRIGSISKIAFEDRLELTYVEPGGRRIRFRPGALPSPLDLLAGALAMDGLPAGQVAGLAGLALDAKRGGPAPGERTVAEWLASHAQGREARRLLWDPIVLATINLPPERACASLLAPVVRRALLAGPRAARMGMAAGGLSPLIADPAVRFLEGRGGEVRTSCAVVRTIVTGGKVEAVETRDGERHRAAAFVVATPAGTQAPEVSPIVAAHVWLDRVVLDAPRIGFLESPFHWAFDRGTLAGGAEGGYVALITSAADDLVDRSREEIAALAVGELRKFLPAARGATVTRVRVVKERGATPVLDVRNVPRRPGTRTGFPNLVLAGDWVDTGLPATLEAAAGSGHRAAAALSL
jgi:squalene-associated FAD-dependent desaturase